MRIDSRIRRLSLGNPGDVRPAGEGVSEIRINYGLGYRVYFVQRGQTLVVLLAGGDKDSQTRDIRGRWNWPGTIGGSSNGEDTDSVLGPGGASGD